MEKTKTEARSGVARCGTTRTGNAFNGRQYHIEKGKHIHLSKAQRIQGIAKEEALKKLNPKDKHYLTNKNMLIMYDISYAMFLSVIYKELTETQFQN